MPEVNRLTVWISGRGLSEGQWLPMVRYDVSMLKFPGFGAFA